MPVQKTASFIEHGKLSPGMRPGGIPTKRISKFLRQLHFEWKPGLTSPPSLASDYPVREI